MYLTNMIMYMKATATHLRNHLFEYLGRVQKGDSITIELNGREIGKIIPLKQRDWRKKVTVEAKLKVKAIDKAFAPLDEIWKNHL